MAIDMPRSALLIEDDKFLSSILKARLERDGVQVELAFDGQEAIQKIATAHPGVILIDLIMPKVSGFEVMQQIALTPQLKNVPIIVLTNLAQDEDIAKAKDLGAKEYFVKLRSPIEDLIKKIEAYLPPPPAAPAAPTAPEAAASATTPAADASAAPLPPSPQA